MSFNHKRVLVGLAISDQTEDTTKPKEEDVTLYFRFDDS